MFDEVSRLDRIHVVNKDGPMNLPPFHTQVTTFVADDDVMAQLFPLSRAVEPLVEVSIETKSDYANTSAKAEVLEPLFKGSKSPQLRICSDHTASVDCAYLPAPTSWPKTASASDCRW